MQKIQQIGLKKGQKKKIKNSFPYTSLSFWCYVWGLQIFSSVQQQVPRARIANCSPSVYTHSSHLSLRVTPTRNEGTFYFPYVLCNMTNGDRKKGSLPSLPSSTTLRLRCVLSRRPLSSAHSRLLLEEGESKILSPVAIQVPAPSDGRNCFRA